MPKKMPLEEQIVRAIGEEKMIIKAISFNPKSKRHIEVLKWLEDEQLNFSSYGRELLAIQYEKSKKTNNNHFQIEEELNIGGLI
jgi:hypothetical protein